MHCLLGICKVKKRPNRTEMLLQKLEVAKEKAEQFDLKYVYHHKIGIPLLDSSEAVATALQQTQAAAAVR